MKKILFSILLLSSTFLMKAQTIKSVGLKLGISSTSQARYFNNMSKYGVYYNSRQGLFTALNLEMFSIKHLSLVTDLSYCQKGYSDDDRNSNTGLFYPEIGAQHNYISLTPTLKIRKEYKHFIPYALLGLRMDYQVGFNPDPGNYSQIKDFNKTVLGFNIGVGYEYKFNNFGVALEAQYLGDFTSILVHSDYHGNPDALKNMGVVWSLGFKYYLNKK